MSAHRILGLEKTFYLLSLREISEELNELKTEEAISLAFLKYFRVK
jgi:hypothetical protein